MTTRRNSSPALKKCLLQKARTFDNADVYLYGKTKTYKYFFLLSTTLYYVTCYTTFFYIPTEVS